VHGPGKLLTIAVFFELSSSSVSGPWIHLEGVLGSAEVIPWVLVVVYRVREPWWTLPWVLQATKSAAWTPGS
jgi:hypothetical protein